MGRERSGEIWIVEFFLKVFLFAELYKPSHYKVFGLFDVEQLNVKDRSVYALFLIQNHPGFFNNAHSPKHHDRKFSGSCHQCNIG
ncbi:hypothetical protein B0B52_14415 [Polaromonas sp. A23]|nr:hypothetical protein B0B52_14415 [Polaromonas sp. A23]